VEDRWNGHLTAILGQFQTALYDKFSSADKNSPPCCGDRAESLKTGARVMQGFGRPENFTAQYRFF
jgi:hypothetical protein